MAAVLHGFQEVIANDMSSMTAYCLGRIHAGVLQCVHYEMITEQLLDHIRTGLLKPPSAADLRSR